MTPLGARIAARARRFGPLPWSAFMDAALYDAEGGFYQTGGSAGRRGDFVTSPEIGPLFAGVVARALDEWWDELGRPDPFVVVEAAAGAGTLAADVLAAGPACSPALRYVLVERSAALRRSQAERLPLELPAFVLGPSDPKGGDPDDDSLLYLPGRGPLVTALAELPALTFPGVVLANELLDNLAVDLLEYDGDRWNEVLVAASGDGDGLIEILVPASPEVEAEADRLIEGDRFSGRAGAGWPSEADRSEADRFPARAKAAWLSGPVGEGGDGPGARPRVPLQRAASAWLRQALGLLEHGRVVVIDYADTTAGLARRPWPDWLRTYRQHVPGGPPLVQPGSQDITCVVASDQLALVRRPDSDRSQDDWLAAHGIEELVEAARTQWRERAAIGDLQAMKARSRVNEADALRDADGLGAFRVLEWTVR